MSFLTLALTACTTSAGAPPVSGTTPAGAAAAPGAPMVSAVAMTEPAPTVAPTRPPTQAPSATATATPDATRAAEATLESIRLTLVATGVPEGSTAFDAQFAAQRCAVAPPATPTAGPFPLKPAGPVTLSADCLGHDLPGAYEQAWVDGRWVEAGRFDFADAADLRAAQRAYEQYFEFLAVQAAPPAADTAAQLAGYMDATETLGSPQSCLASDVAGALSGLRARGQYVRLTAPAGLAWNAAYRLYVGPKPYQVSLDWQVRSLRQELVDAQTGQVLRTATRPALAGTAWLRFEAGRWRVFDDAGGYYCAPLADFLRTSGAARFAREN